MVAKMAALMVGRLVVNSVASRVFRTAGHLAEQKAVSSVVLWVLMMVVNSVERKVDSMVEHLAVYSEHCLVE